MPISGVIEIGDIQLLLRFDNTAFFSYFHNHYQAFFVSKLPQYDIHISELPAPGQERSLRVNQEDHTLLLRYQHFSGTIDLKRHTASIQLLHHPVVLENFLRCFISVIAPAHDSVLFKCLGICYERAGTLFSGSWELRRQLADMLPDSRVLSDTLVLVQKKPDRTVAYGTPFSADIKVQTRRNKCALQRMYFARSGGETIVRNMKSSDVLMGMLENSFITPYNAQIPKQYMRFLEDLMRRVTCRSAAIDTSSLSAELLLTSLCS